MSHMLVMGETQSGKTFYANQIHRAWDRVSIFVNTNETPDVWGRRCPSLGRLLRCLAHDKKVNFVPSADRDKARGELEDIKDTMLDLSRTWSGGEPWCQIVVDEAQLYDKGQKSDPLEDLARRGLGKGIRVVAVTQYPTGIKTGTRTNLATRIVFRPGLEGTSFIRSQWSSDLAERIQEWTEDPYHYASKAPGRGWEYHEPVTP